MVLKLCYEFIDLHSSMMYFVKKEFTFVLHMVIFFCVVYDTVKVSKLSPKILHSGNILIKIFFSGGL